MTPYLVSKTTKEHFLARSFCAADANDEDLILVKADADGWIDRHGGECPLPDDQRCEVKTGHSQQIAKEGAMPASYWCWVWLRQGDGGDIIAYRPIFDDKSQAGPYEWNGEGLPDIGCRVSYPSGRGIIRLPPDAHNVVIVEDDEDGYKRVALSICELIRADREKWIEAAIDAHANADYPSNEFEAIYDALKSGELPQP